MNPSKVIYCTVKLGYSHTFPADFTDTIDNLRKFHNFIKSALIAEAQQLTNGKTLLDIAVGRGGDLLKWKRANFKVVVGFDPHKESLSEAGTRLNDSLKNKVKLPFVKYYNADALDRGISGKLSKFEENIRGVEDGLYDVISCQFAFHYFAGSQQNLNHVLSFISSKLKTGGVFIGTATDGDLIKTNLDNGDINLKLLQVKKVDSTTYSFNIASKSGTQTYFDVKGASVEHFLFKKTLIETAKDYDLEVINIRSFYEWFINYDGKMTPMEQLISFLNFSFIFRKI